MHFTKSIPYFRLGFNKVKKIQQFIGLECEGYKEQFTALLTEIKSDYTQVTKTTSKKYELNRLT